MGIKLDMSKANDRLK